MTTPISSSPSSPPSPPSPSSDPVSSASSMVVGQRVQICASPPANKDDPPKWVASMDQYCNQYGTVVHISSSGFYLVLMADGNNRLFHPQWVTPVSRPVGDATTAGDVLTTLRLGDPVKAAPSSDDGELAQLMRQLMALRSALGGGLEDLAFVGHVSALDGRDQTIRITSEGEDKWFRAAHVVPRPGARRLPSGQRPIDWRVGQRVAFKGHPAVRDGALGVVQALSWHGGHVLLDGAQRSQWCSDLSLLEESTLPPPLTQPAILSAAVPPISQLRLGQVVQYGAEKGVIRAVDSTDDTVQVGKSWKKYRTITAVGPPPEVPQEGVVLQIDPRRFAVGQTARLCQESPQRFACSWGDDHDNFRGRQGEILLIDGSDETVKMRFGAVGQQSLADRLVWCHMAWLSLDDVGASPNVTTSSMPSLNPVLTAVPSISGEEAAQRVYERELRLLQGALESARRAMPCVTLSPLPLRHPRLLETIKTAGFRVEKGGDAGAIALAWDINSAPSTASVAVATSDSLRLQTDSSSSTLPIPTAAEMASAFRREERGYVYGAIHRAIEAGEYEVTLQRPIQSTVLLEELRASYHLLETESGHLRLLWMPVLG